MSTKLELTGKRFYNLVVLYENVNRDNGHVTWHCKCDCGNEIDVLGSNLTRGNTKSCGCRRFKSKREDLSRQKFGLLTTQRIDHIDNKRRAYYLCQCQCGNTTIVRSDHLKSGKIISCGCFHKSKGEEKIKSFLTKYNIPFVEQKTFEDCKHERILRFDFYIDNKYIIEYDGIQHFKSNGGWNKKGNVQIVQQRDAIKNNYCIENNIPLIRIPYTHYDDIIIDDLKLETSKYIYQEATQE